MNNVTLSNGLIVPQMAIGTNWMNKKQLKDILVSAFNCGFRSIDTARDYGNEDVVGIALKEALKETGLDREDIIITTKIGNSQQVNGNINFEIDKSLTNLQVEYIDVYLMHWPYPGYFCKTWEKMVKLYQDTQKVKAIGVANYALRHFEILEKEEPGIMPMLNQVEFHPLRTIQPVMAYMKEHNIALEAYAPLCRLMPPLADSIILNDLAKKYSKSIGQIILRWHIQHGVIPIFKSYNPNRFKENIDIFNFEMTEQEIAEIDSLNIDYKYHLESASCPGY